MKILENVKVVITVKTNDNYRFVQEYTNYVTKLQIVPC